jgi:hypothetical protein
MALGKENVQKIKRIIPNKEVAKKSYYADMAILSRIFDHPIIEDCDGIWRWKANQLTEYILGRPKGSSCYPYKIDLNDLCIQWHEGKFSLEEYMKWQMDIGYSLSGFSEIFNQDLIELVIKAHSKGKDKNWMLIETPWKT